MIGQGIYLTMLTGPTVPAPAPPWLLESLESVEVTHSDKGRSGFQVIFQAGRSGPADAVDFALLRSQLFKAFNRIVITITLKGVPGVLMDGIITQQELAPGTEAGSSRLTLTGEDVSLMMDREEKSEEHPAQDETVIAKKIILSYAQYGLIPVVIPPFLLDPPLPIERIPTQQGTDLDYLQDMAKRYAYVFYVTPGPVPLTNTAYWGPPIREKAPQRALTVDMGSATNVDSINFRNNSLAPTLVSGKIQDRHTNQSQPVRSFTSTRVPLSREPAFPANAPYVKHSQFRQCGLNTMQASARAQGMTDASVDDVVTATGDLNVIRYGDLLEPRRPVGLRGVGFQYDGLYYVKKVTHRITREEYKQSFTISREGTGSTTPVVPV